MTAIKFTDTNIVRYGHILERFGEKLKIFAGFDETLLATTILGGEAAICASFSLAAPVAAYNVLVESLQTGEIGRARQAQLQIVHQIEQLKGNGNFFASLKAKLNEELVEAELFFGTPRAPVLIPLD